MTSERIKEIQEQTAYPESRSVMLALKRVWNECAQEKSYTEEDLIEFATEVSNLRNFEGRVLSMDEHFKKWLKAGK